MMFASKPPRDLNHDPEPWVTRPQRFPEFGEPKHHAKSVYCDDFCMIDPRPEFDHVQHNEPNPILVKFREALGGEAVTATGELYWALRDVNRTSLWLRGKGRPIPAQLNHARRVLARLANLSQTGADA